MFTGKKIFEEAPQLRAFVLESVEISDIESRDYVHLLSLVCLPEHSKDQPLLSSQDHPCSVFCFV
ncbi:hypothetical protein TBGT1765_06061 [Thermotoga sp. TBGT1765]|nr:hypothetical protein T2812B_01595 [Thermotoga sp. 2812B]AIY87680.1 hypothetical protein CELL2_01660 [Thermotoga sp. Cell2]EJX26844.1 hypothetical protein EMP_01177 [Thermotoga sp. EMP]KHC92609.1 hypothetical protein TBGT1765_06061 [Thermotoga sp. TBGT1765]KHC96377.1 hypothetical protein XYL54_04251 [Thermotoga sp. Xyl54]